MSVRRPERRHTQPRGPPALLVRLPPASGYQDIGGDHGPSSSSKVHRTSRARALVPRSCPFHPFLIAGNSNNCPGSRVDAPKRVQVLAGIRNPRGDGATLWTVGRKAPTRTRFGSSRCFSRRAILGTPLRHATKAGALILSSWIHDCPGRALRPFLIGRLKPRGFPPAPIASAGFRDKYEQPPGPSCDGAGKRCQEHFSPGGKAPAFVQNWTDNPCMKRVKNDESRA